MAQTTGRALIATDQCQGCGLCVSVCPLGILVLDTAALNAKGYGPAAVAEPDRCTGCGNCGATCAVIMNLPSLLKFESAVVAGGRIFVNSSLINRQERRSDIEAWYIPANELAAECGNSRAANMVMLGAYLAVAAPVRQESVIEAFRKVFGGKGRQLFDLNVRALQAGAGAVAGVESHILAAA